MFSKMLAKRVDRVNYLHSYPSRFWSYEYVHTRTYVFPADRATKLPGWISARTLHLNKAHGTPASSGSVVESTTRRCTMIYLLVFNVKACILLTPQ